MATSGDPPSKSWFRFRWTPAASLLSLVALGVLLAFYWVRRDTFDRQIGDLAGQCETPFDVVELKVEPIAGLKTDSQGITFSVRGRYRQTRYIELRAPEFFEPVARRASAVLSRLEQLKTSNPTAAPELAAQFQSMLPITGVVFRKLCVEGDECSFQGVATLATADDPQKKKLNVRSVTLIGDRRRTYSRLDGVWGLDFDEAQNPTKPKRGSTTQVVDAESADSISRWDAHAIVDQVPAGAIVVTDLDSTKLPQFRPLIDLMERVEHLAERARRAQLEMQFADEATLKEMQSKVWKFSLPGSDGQVREMRVDFLFGSNRGRGVVLLREKSHPLRRRAFDVEIGPTQVETITPDGDRIRHIALLAVQHMSRAGFMMFDDGKSEFGTIFEPVFEIVPDTAGKVVLRRRGTDFALTSVTELPQAEYPQDLSIKFPAYWSDKTRYAGTLKTPEGKDRRVTLTIAYDGQEQSCYLESSDDPELSARFTRVLVDTACDWPIWCRPSPSTAAEKKPSPLGEHNLCLYFEGEGLVGRLGDAGVRLSGKRPWDRNAQRVEPAN